MILNIVAVRHTHIVVRNILTCTVHNAAGRLLDFGPETSDIVGRWTSESYIWPKSDI